MTIALAEREIILRELKSMPCGNKADLESKLKSFGLSSKVIEDVCGELGLVGVIRYGYDGLGNLRFKLTDFGQSYCDSFLSFHDTEQRLIRLAEKLDV